MRLVKLTLLFASTVILVVAVLVPVGFAWATPVLDQDHSTVAPGNQGISVPMDPGTLTAQIFTAGMTGALTQINLAILTVYPFSCDYLIPPCVPGDLTISIRDTVPGIVHDAGVCSHTEPRMIPSDTDLASATVPAAAVPFGGSFGMLPITFAAPAHVKAGHVYAIVAQLGGSERYVWVADSGTVDPYPGGTMFATYNCGQGWIDLSNVELNAEPSGFYVKALFQTFVDPKLTPPTNLQASQISSAGTQVLPPPTQVTLIWDYGNDSVDGFTIERKMISDNWDQAATAKISLSAACSPSTGTASTQTCVYTDIDNALSNFATFLYRVSAYQGSNSSDFSAPFKFQLTVPRKPLVVIGW